MIDIKKVLEGERVEVTFAEINVDRDYVKAFRKKHDLTQAALASILGVTKKTIEKWEQGVNKVGGSSAVLMKLLNDNPVLISQLYNVELCPEGTSVERDNTLEYKGYRTKVEYCAEGKVLYGKIEEIKDLVNFESDSVDRIEKEFHSAVDDYLALCEEDRAIIG